MLYIVTALKSEAQAFVDAYKLKKSRINSYTLFSNKSLTIIVSGVGITNARLATQTLFDYFDMNQDDIIVNIGVCGAPSHTPIGTLLRIDTIVYNTTHYQLTPHTHNTLACIDTPATHHTTYVDMESFGFYDAITHNPAIQNYAIFKVVSDHFQPHTLTKDMVKQLIFQKKDAILKQLNF